MRCEKPGTCEGGSAQGQGMKCAGTREEVRRDDAEDLGWAFRVRS